MRKQTVKRILLSVAVGMAVIVVSMFSIMLGNLQNFTASRTLFGRVLFWPMFIFEPMFHQPAEFAEWFNVEAGIASLVFDLLAYSLLTYVILWLRARHRWR